MKAANGAARTPPATRPAIIGHNSKPIVATNVAVITIVTKNSARFVEPMARRGIIPHPIKVEVTIAPHPPPPIASSNPPIMPSGTTCVGVEIDAAVLRLLPNRPNCAPHDHDTHSKKIQAYELPND
jgi:hypothetical protein